MLEEASKNGIKVRAWTLQQSSVEPVSLLGRGPDWGYYRQSQAFFGITRLSGFLKCCRIGNVNPEPDRKRGCPIYRALAAFRYDVTTQTMKKAISTRFVISVTRASFPWRRRYACRRPQYLGQCPRRAQ